MTNGVPTLGQVEHEWNPGRLSEAGAAITAANDEFSELIEQMVAQIRDAGATWEGESYLAAYDRIAGDRDNGRRVAATVSELAAVIRLYSGSVESYRTVVLAAVTGAREAGFTVTDQWSVEAVASSTPEADQQRFDHQTAITSALSELLTVVNDAAAAIEQAAKEVRADGDTIGAGDEPLAGQSNDDAARTAAASAVFENVFGRKPVSANDWSTANALNPNTYDSKYNGIPSEVRIARITPVPGQGVVRAAQFISPDEVIGAPQDFDDLGHPYDLGDKRIEDRNFDPEQSRVSTYIDYENGVVVMRQNPSVTADGEVEVGVPEADVWQLEDGSLRVRYDAKNPFAPDIDTGHTVNGDLVFTPGPDGVTVDGTRTDYPSLEVYQDWPNGEIRTVAIDPAKSGESWGPLANLPFHHDIGAGEYATEPFKTYPWSGGDLPAPQDLPWTSVGPAGAPPTVEIVRPEYSTARPTA